MEIQQNRNLTKPIRLSLPTKMQPDYADQKLKACAILSTPDSIFSLDKIKSKLALGKPLPFSFIFLQPLNIMIMNILVFLLFTVPHDNGHHFTGSSLLITWTHSICTCIWYLYWLQEM